MVAVNQNQPPTQCVPSPPPLPCHCGIPRAQYRGSRPGPFNVEPAGGCVCRSNNKQAKNCFIFLVFTFEFTYIRTFLFFPRVTCEMVKLYWRKFLFLIIVMPPPPTTKGEIPDISIPEKFVFKLNIALDCQNSKHSGFLIFLYSSLRPPPRLQCSCVPTHINCPILTI